MSDDFEIQDALPIVDRSTLEAFGCCPMQGHLKATTVRSVNLIAETGTEVHRAISETVSFYVDAFDRFPSRLEIKEYFLTRLRESRPDVQPDAMSAASRAAWKLSEYLCNLAPKNILCFDGGQGKRSGQLGVDLETVPIRATAEIDMLHATESKAVVAEVDYKSGHKFWTEADIAASFQFGAMHPVLVFERFPEIECVRISIFNTRSNVISYAVDFTRDRLPEYRMRVERAASEWYRVNVLKQPAEAWPARDKCAICDCISVCPVADADLATDPKEQLTQLVHLETKLKTLKDRLSAVVKETGRDVRLDDGTSFGWFDKPKSTRKPEAAVYVAKGEEA